MFLVGITTKTFILSPIHRAVFMHFTWQINTHEHRLHLIKRKVKQMCLKTTNILEIKDISLQSIPQSPGRLKPRSSKYLIWVCSKELLTDWRRWIVNYPVDICLDAEFYCCWRKLLLLTVRRMWLDVHLCVMVITAEIKTSHLFQKIWPFDIGVCTSSSPLWWMCRRSVKW